jgi:flavodoxin
MSIKIYYFSGTGNSLVAAKEIARRVNVSLIDETYV